MAWHLQPAPGALQGLLSPQGPQLVCNPKVLLQQPNPSAQTLHSQAWALQVQQGEACQVQTLGSSLS